MYVVVQVKREMHIYESYCTCVVPDVQILRAREFLSAVTGQDDDYTVKIHMFDIDGYARQGDTRSCGVFVAITIAHLLERRRMLNLHHEHVSNWRNYMAAKIMELKFGVQ